MGEQEKIMWNFQWSWFLALEFSRDLLQFCRISRGGALLYLGFPWVKNKISQWYVLNAPVCFFSGIAQLIQCLTQEI